MAIITTAQPLLPSLEIPVTADLREAGRCHLHGAGEALELWRCAVGRHAMGRHGRQCLTVALLYRDGGIVVVVVNS